MDNKDAVSKKIIDVMGAKAIEELRAGNATPLIALLDSDGWTHGQESEVLSESDEEVVAWGTVENLEHVTELAAVSSTKGPLEIWTNHQVSYTRYDEYSIDVSHDLPDRIPKIEILFNGFMVNGIPDEAIFDLLANLPEAFTQVDLKCILRELRVENRQELPRDAEEEVFKLEVFNRPNLRFSGKLIGEATSEEDRGRWQVLELYLTEGGNYVAVERHSTCWPSDGIDQRARVCRNLTEVSYFFGEHELKKQLLDSMFSY